MILILLGAPGAGKGTQARILSDELGVVHVSSGDLLREHRKAGTELGQAAGKYMVKGELVPDDLVIDMIMDRISLPDAEHGVLLDGFPRTIAQAEALDAALEQRGKMVGVALYINVPREVLLDRLSGRLTCRRGPHVFHEQYAPPKVPGVCDECGGELYQRDDDKRETAVNRLEVYFRKTMPIIDYYRQRKVLCEVDGAHSVGDVSKLVVACLR